MKATYIKTDSHFFITIDGVTYIVLPQRASSRCLNIQGINYIVNEETQRTITRNKALIRLERCGVNFYNFHLYTFK